MTPAPPVEQTQLTDKVIDAVMHDDDFHLSTDFFRKLCAQAKRHNALRAQIDAAGGEVAEPPHAIIVIGRQLLPTQRAVTLEPHEAWVEYAKTLATAYAALRVRVGELERSAPLCSEHISKHGTRSGCPYCAMLKLSHALSKIDYACGEPNEMEVSGYDVHCNEDAVVAHITTLAAENAALKADAERYRYLKTKEPASHQMILNTPWTQWDAAIDAAIAAQEQK